MSQLKTYDKCKHFGFPRCPHRHDEIMQRGTEEPGDPKTTLSFPKDEKEIEEINRICENCDVFIRK